MNTQKQNHITPSYLDYAKNVLGINTIITPPQLRYYKLHQQNSSKPSLLFFYSTQNNLHTYSINKTLINKISSALSLEKSFIVEITDIKNKHITQLLANLCTRFTPLKGIVICGTTLAQHLMPQNYNLGDVNSLKINTQTITTCVIHPLEELIESTAITKNQMTKNKAQTWSILTRIMG